MRVNSLKTAISKSFSAARLSKTLSSLLFPAMFFGCAAGPMTPTQVFADQHTLIQPTMRDDRAQLMYEIMIAELAGRRGYVEVATEGYLRAARRTDDPRVAERATKLAVWAQTWEQAQAGARRWLELDPDSTEARELLAQVLMRSEQPDGTAVDEFSNLVEESEDRGAVLFDIYVLLSREQDRDSALETLLGLQKRFPEEVEAHMGVARMLLQQNDRDGAMQAVEQAIAVDATDGEVLLFRAQLLVESGKPVEGLDEIKVALKEDPDNVRLRIGFARLLANSGRYSEASEELEYLYENEQNNPDVLLSIGLLALDSKRTDAAERYLETLRRTGEHRDQAHFYLGRIDDQKQLFEEAISHYEKVSEGDLYFSAQLRAAELYAASGQLDVGIDRVRSLASLLPDPAMQPMLITTESHMLQDAGKNDVAVEVLSDGLKKFPDNGELLYARALASEKVGDRDTLMSDLRTLIESDPNNATALNALGYFLADEDTNLDEAEGYLEKAVQLRPDDAAIMDSLGWLRFRQGKIESAKKLLERAYELFPDGEIAAHLGEVLWTIGDETAAKSVWDKALLDSPDHVKLLNTVERLTQ